MNEQEIRRSEQERIWNAVFNMCHLLDAVSEKEKEELGTMSPRMIGRLNDIIFHNENGMFGYEMVSWTKAKKVGEEEIISVPQRSQ